MPVPSTLLLLFTYLTYLVLGTCVFWVLESPAAHDSSKRFQSDKWALLRNFTCLDGQALDSLIRVRGESGRPGRGGAGSADRTGTGRKGTVRLRSGHRQEHFSEIKWKARTRGRLGARVAGRRPESWAGWPPMQRPRLGREKCAARRREPRVRGERRNPPCPESCVARASKSRGEGDRGRTDGVQGWWARPGPGGVKTERAAQLGRRREGSTWEFRALCGVGQRAKGEGVPMAPSTGDPHANLRPGDGDSRGRWSGLMMIEPAARSLEAGRKGDAERSCPRCHTHTHTHKTPQVKWNGAEVQEPGARGFEVRKKKAADTGKFGG